MKYKIEKNTVQETLIIPLFARKVCSELYPNLYRDETAWFSQIDASVSGFFRLHAKVGDNGMKMQIVKIGF